MVNNVDLDQNGISESALRNLVEEKLAESPAAHWGMKNHQRRSSMNFEFARLSWRCKMGNSREFSWNQRRPGIEYQDIYDFPPVRSVAIYHCDGSMRLLQR